MFRSDKRARNVASQRAVEQAHAADSPLAGFFGRLRGRAAEAHQRSVLHESILW